MYNVIETMNNMLGYNLGMMRCSKRKNYYYGKALRMTESFKKHNPECAEAIDKEWKARWYRKYRKALA